MQLTVTSPGFAPVTKIIDATHEYGLPANLDGDVWLREQLSKDMCATIFFDRALQICSKITEDGVASSCPDTPSSVVVPESRGPVVGMGASGASDR